jgi:hypothetical protein
MAVSDDLSHFATLFQRGDSSLDTLFIGLHLAAHHFSTAVDQDQ